MQLLDSWRGGIIVRVTLSAIQWRCALLDTLQMGFSTCMGPPVRATHCGLARPIFGASKTALTCELTCKSNAVGHHCSYASKGHFPLGFTQCIPICWQGSADQMLQAHRVSATTYALPISTNVLQASQSCGLCKSPCNMMKITCTQSLAYSPDDPNFKTTIINELQALEFPH